MAVTIYRSTDASAPVLSGTAGALIGVLDACLVNGYGAQPAAGWTKEYSGTNTASYKQPAGSNGFYLDVNDTGTQSARVRGYETMTAVATGTGPFPTDAQISGGGWFMKSDTASAAARPWILVTNGEIFYFFSQYDSAAAFTGAAGMAFGDFVSYKPGDLYNTVLIAGSASGIASSAMMALSSGVGTTTAGHYVARAHTAVAGSTPVGKHSDAVKLASSNAGAGGITYPNGADGGLYIAPLWLNETNVVRGELPGLWTPCHLRPISHGDTFSGAGALAGKTFEAINHYTTSQFAVETSNTW